jgi:hypothetical protein
MNASTSIRKPPPTSKHSQACHNEYILCTTWIDNRTRMQWFDTTNSCKMLKLQY